MSDNNNSRSSGAGTAGPGFGRRSRNMVFPAEKLSREEVKINIKRIVSLLMPYKTRLVF